jgi:hypothetical protein
MSDKLAKVRLIKINGQVILARREAKIPDIKQWFERNGDEAGETHILSFTDRAFEGKLKDPCYSQLIEEKEFELEDLPMFIFADEPAKSVWN